MQRNKGNTEGMARSWQCTQNLCLCLRHLCVQSCSTTSHHTSHPHDCFRACLESPHSQQLAGARQSRRTCV